MPLAFRIILVALLGVLVWLYLRPDYGVATALGVQQRIRGACLARYDEARTGADTARIDKWVSEGFDRIGLAQGPACGDLRTRGTLGR
jgi:hypothetical protein